MPIGEADFRPPTRSARVGVETRCGREEETWLTKIKVATTSLAGCFGCHMSFLDIDERILAPGGSRRIRPFSAYRHQALRRLATSASSKADVCNAENVHVLREFRENCKILVAVGACAINGGLPAMRNHFPLQECLEEAYCEQWASRTRRSRMTLNYRCCSTRFTPSTKLSGRLFPARLPALRR